MSKILALAALLLSGCATSPQADEWPCYSWEGRDVRMLNLEAMAPPEFVCSERICYGRHGDQAGKCYYGCPEERLPEFCR